MRTLLASLCLLFICTIAHAQKTMMMGMITDATGKPVAGATIEAIREKTSTKVITDNDGLYNIIFIAVATYHVAITANNITYPTQEIILPVAWAVGQPKEFYNFTLAGGQAVLHISHDVDPFMVSKLEKIESSLNTADPVRIRKR